MTSPEGRKVWAFPGLLNGIDLSVLRSATAGGVTYSAGIWQDGQIEDPALVHGWGIDTIGAKKGICFLEFRAGDRTEVWRTARASAALISCCIRAETLSEDGEVVINGNEADNFPSGAIVTLRGLGFYARGQHLHADTALLQTNILTALPLLRSPVLIA